MTAREIARILRISTGTVHKLLRAGKLKGEKVGGAWHVRREAFEDFLEKARTRRA